MQKNAERKIKKKFVENMAKNGDPSAGADFNFSRIAYKFDLRSFCNRRYNSTMFLIYMNASLFPSFKIHVTNIARNGLFRIRCFTRPPS